MQAIKAFFRQLFGARSVYVVTAYFPPWCGVKDVLVFSNFEAADAEFRYLRSIYGSENVALFSRDVLNSSV